MACRSYSAQKNTQRSDRHNHNYWSELQSQPLDAAARASIGHPRMTPRDVKPPEEQRAFLLYYARVLLREARSRRGQNIGWMIAGAARARREAMAIRPAQQMEMF